MKKFTLLTTATVLMALSGIASADNSVSPYVEVKGGYSKLTYDSDILSGDASDSVGMFALAAGINLNNGTIGYRGEGEWTIYSKFKDDVEYYGRNFDFSFTAHTIMFNNYMDFYLADSFKLYGMAGMGVGLIKDAKFSYKGISAKDNFSSFAWQAGVGFVFKPTNNLGLDLAWRYSNIYKNHGDKIYGNTVLLGISYDF